MPSLSFVYPEALWLLLLLIPIVGLALSVPRRLARWQFWSSLGLRSIMLLAVILSLAGAQLVQPVQRLTTVFLLDGSDSVTPSARGQAETFIQAALQQMADGDQAALVVFGNQALVERAPSSATTLGRLTSAPLPDRTNIEQAIELGLALLPADTHKRLVLLSDGGENSGNALTAARLAAARGVPIEVVDLDEVGAGDEVLIANLEAPSRVRDGQELVLIAEIISSVAQPARVRLLADQTVVSDQTEQLEAGVNRVRFVLPASGQGFQRYRVRVEAAADSRLQNNEATALVQIQGPPRVLLVAALPDEAAPLQAALAAANIDAEVTSPGRMPADLAGLSAYDAVVLVNVPARALPVAAMATLPIYVRDLGKGLLMVGGAESYGVGGYGRTAIEEALPVYMDVRNREQRPDLALVFVIDKSGSMDACHCSDPDRRTAQFQQGGERKIDIAKEAVTQASTLLGPQDTIGVVAFDDAAHWIVPATQGATPEQVAEAVSNVEPNGMTNVRTGLVAAEETLAGIDARIKHIILLTDGWGHGGDNLDIAERLRQQGITLSVVAAGSGSANYLERLAVNGGGRYYPSQTMSDVPQIFLQETITAVGNYLVEEPFAPVLTGDSPILHGLGDGVPLLYGYNGTTLKDTARSVLSAGDATPLLAQWQYGLGRSIAWTSDLKGQWARDWVAWEAFPRFAAQLVGWVLPVRSDQSVTTELRVEGATTALRVQVAATGDRPHADLALTTTLVGSDGMTTTVELVQVAPGDYRGRVASPAPGTYLVQVAGRSGDRAVVQEVAGLVVPYSAEYGPNQGNPALLTAIADMTGGGVLADPAAAFAPVQGVVRRAQEIALPLLLLALLLLPFDIAVRRVLVRQRDLAAARGRMLAWLPQRPAPVTADPTLTRLAQAKQRATRPDNLEARMPPREAPASPPREAPASPPPVVPPGDPLERLREAKERARRRARGEE